MLHEKVGKHGTRNRGRYQVAQSWLNILYLTEIARMWNLQFENLNEAKKKTMKSWNNGERANFKSDNECFYDLLLLARHQVGSL